jgi:type II secretory pathway pseudopilin PulG
LIRREEGFTLVELMITMVMFVFVIAAASQVFTGLLTQFKQQSKIAETNIEGIVGLDMLRRDVENAGYGLPWVMPATAKYSEVPLGSAGSAYDECAATTPPPHTCNTPPKAVLAGSGAGWNGSDELVIRGANVARSATAQTWTTLRTGDTKMNGLSGESFTGTDRVIIISPGSTTANARRLVVNSADSADWDTTYNATSNFDPGDATETYVIYGIVSNGAGGALWMPFNRTDYYISTTNVPARCASNTGVLMKSVLSQTDGTRTDFLPVLDCVADIQVVFRFDTSVPRDGIADLVSDDISALTAEQIREQLMDVRVYVLAHEGQRDPNFTYSKNPVYVGDAAIGGSRNFNFTTVANPVADWKNYRWKLYSMVVKPINLRQ